jgi:CheY-like chemotaxis protein
MAGLLLSDDLLFTSRIAGTARSLGLEIKSAKTAAALMALAAQSPPTCVLVDLQNPGLEVETFVKGLKEKGVATIVAYGSHVDTATLKAARDAGCDVVLPRSKFVESLATELPQWLGSA